MKPLCSLPWLISGDFNEILNREETFSKLKYSVLIIQFRDVLDDCNLSDLGFNGAPFTFSNKRKGQYECKVRLDTSVASPEWRMAFPTARNMHLTAI